MPVDAINVLGFIENMGQVFKLKLERKRNCHHATKSH